MPVGNILFSHKTSKIIKDLPSTYVTNSPIFRLTCVVLDIALAGCQTRLQRPGGTLLIECERLQVVGGGLAGCEAAWQAISQGIPTTIYEMRPTKSTAAHKTGNLAELVCSNSLKSLIPTTAPGQLKQEMRFFESLILNAAEHAKVPAGNALAVDRNIFSTFITETLRSHPLVTIVSEEVRTLPSSADLAAQNSAMVIATGPLTADDLCQAIEQLCIGSKRLHFYDAIAPTVLADSIDPNHAFRASRYDKDESGVGDYLNLPLDKEQYVSFIEAVKSAEYMPLHGFEETKYFESCLPIEVMAERGDETLRFGPMKPVGLTDPRTGRWPYAAVQLRQENIDATMYSMVGFQTKMKWPEQRRVFGMIPALKNAEFLRYGSVHRNTYVKGPAVLEPNLSFKTEPRIFLAGQITGVEGYTESSAIGILAGRAAIAKIRDQPYGLPPKESVMGALAHYVAFGTLGAYQPMNANFGLLPAIQRERGESKANKKARMVLRAREAFSKYSAELQPDII